MLGRNLFGINERIIVASQGLQKRLGTYANKQTSWKFEDSHVSFATCFPDRETPKKVSRGRCCAGCLRPLPTISWIPKILLSWKGKLSIKQNDLTGWLACWLACWLTGARRAGALVWGSGFGKPGKTHATACTPPSPGIHWNYNKIMQETFLVMRWSLGEHACVHINTCFFDCRSRAFIFTAK